MPTFPLRRLAKKIDLEAPIKGLLDVFELVLNFKLKEQGLPPTSQQQLISAIITEYLLTNREQILDDYEAAKHAHLDGVARAIIEGTPAYRVPDVRGTSGVGGHQPSAAKTFLRALRTASGQARGASLSRRARAAVEILRAEPAADAPTPARKKAIRRAKRRGKRRARPLHDRVRDRQEAHGGGGGETGENTTPTAENKG